MLPDLLGDKGHIGVQETQALIEYSTQDAAGVMTKRFVALHLHFGNLDIPVAIVRPEKIVHLTTSFTQLEIRDQARRIIDQVSQTTEYPAIGQCLRLYFIKCGHTAPNLGSRHQYKARGVPDFVSKVAVANNALRHKFHVVTRRAASCQGET